MNLIRRLVILVGAPGSGKDALIRAIKDLGTPHAKIVPKHTTREKWNDDSSEMLFPKDPDYNMSACDIVYENYGNQYGIESARIWKGLHEGEFQVVVVSNVDAINRLHDIFGELVLMVYVHSVVDADQYERKEKKQGKEGDYLKRRVADYNRAYNIYLENFLAFDHVLIYSGIKEDAPFGLEEDLYDQIFRLFRAYERGDVNYPCPKPARQRQWNDVRDQFAPDYGGEDF